MGRFTSRTSRWTTTLAGSRRVIGGGTSGALVRTASTAAPAWAGAAAAGLAGGRFWADASWVDISTNPKPVTTATMLRKPGTMDRGAMFSPLSFLEITAERQTRKVRAAAK
jgi:hypothetical protein